MQLLEPNSHLRTRDIPSRFIPILRPRIIRERQRRQVRTHLANVRAKMTV